MLRSGYFLYMNNKNVLTDDVAFDLIIFLFSIECNRSTHNKHYVVFENEKLSYNKDHFYSLQTNYFVYFI